ncbi:hypothetical protein D0Z00_000788 [Geotrichum galactomycetum]|uniref:Uncharacterized protein n=1 Tax=Geotrichum galactomycetum TaxID=27317 RepID=A0ACB6V8L6_9ASCO|nr:hypothetical protein D0Z00_000788 [Geotrichum candidum]
MDLESQQKRGKKSVGFAEGPGSDSDDDAGFTYDGAGASESPRGAKQKKMKKKRGTDYVYLESGDLANSASNSAIFDTAGNANETNDFLDDEDYEANDPKAQAKGKGYRNLRRSRGNNSGSSRKHLSNRRGRRNDPKFIKMGLIIFVPIILLLSMFLLVSMASSNESKNASPVVAPTGSSYPSGFNIKNNWGALSPYFDSGTPFTGIEPPAAVDAGVAINSVPTQCRLRQAHVLHRHAERFPTSRIAREMEAFAKRIKNMTEPPAATFSWLGKWQYRLHDELLVASGVGVEFQSGSDFWASHGRQLFNATAKDFLFYDPSLYTDENGIAKKLVLRTTDQSRIQTSAKAWAAGFFGAFGDDPKRTQNSPLHAEDLYSFVYQAESDGMNSTLASYFSCPNSNNETYNAGYNLTTEWINTYLAETVIRLQKLLPGLHNMTQRDAFLMQNLCAYETAAFKTSPFCGLFTETEWRGFEYTSDLSFYGTSSFGTLENVGAAQGAGWLYELKARLEERYITASSSPQNYGVNISQTDNANDFPLDQPLYADFTHDSIIVSVLSALGLDLVKEKKLTGTKIPVPRQFIVSRLTPFGARLFVEVLDCDGSTEEEEEIEDDSNEVIDTSKEKSENMKEGQLARRGSSVNKNKSNYFVRLKLNNRILPLGSLKHCPDDKGGLCKYDKFVKSLDYALKQIDFEKSCFGVI